MLAGVVIVVFGLASGVVTVAWAADVSSADDWSRRLWAPAASQLVWAIGWGVVSAALVTGDQRGSWKVWLLIGTALQFLGPPVTCWAQRRALDGPVPLSIETESHPTDVFLQRGGP